MDKDLIMDSERQTNKGKKAKNLVQVGPRDLDQRGVDLDQRGGRLRPEHRLSGIVYPLIGGKGPGVGVWVQVGLGRTWTRKRRYSPKNKVFIPLV